jgi:CSLREA domain-containing protein
MINTTRCAAWTRLLCAMMLTVLALTGLRPAAADTWVSNGKNADGRALNATWFASATAGWAVGNDGAIRKTTNGGTTWTTQTSGTTNALTSVWGSDTNTLWAVGTSGIILKTTNGGTSWTAQTSGTMQVLRSVWGSDADTLWTVGDGGTIRKTTDGGTSWTAQTSGTSSSLRSVWGIDADTAWTMGNSGTILKTTDGGTNWTAQTSGTTETLQSVWGSDAGTLWAVGARGTILKTTDGGTSWTTQTSNTTQTLQSVRGSDANTVWAVGFNGTILKTTDGGTNWTFQNSGTANSLNSVWGSDAGTLWAVGGSGTILKTTNGGANWTIQTSNTNQTLNSVWGSDANTVWTVGNVGTIRKTTDGGTSWTPQISGTSNALFGIWGSDASTVWAVGDVGTILNTANGGISWTTQTSGTSQLLLSVWGSDADTVWAVGPVGTILKTTDGGANWTAQNSGTNQNLHSVWGSDAGTLWAVGGNGTILKTTDGGTNWTPQTSSTSQTLLSVWGSGAGTLWAVGTGGTIRKTTDGGANWAAQTSGTNQTLFSVWGSDAGTLWAVGQFGTIRKTTDGGANWTADTSNTTQDRRGVWGSDATHVFAVGALGLIQTNVPPPPPTITGFTPTRGPVGTTVTITGTNFIGATDVSFNGTAAVNPTITDTQIPATVPSGATTGAITVTAPNGTATTTGLATPLFTVFDALIVTTTADTVDANDGLISLREAIDYANTNPGSDLIRFNMPVGERVGNLWTIQPTTQLTLTDPGTQILGSTQSGFVKRNPVVVLDGALAPAGTSGVLITTSNCYVSSLKITGFTGGDPAANGIRVTGAGSVNNTFWGNLISGNAGIAIDLGGDGASANDGGDSDSGANNLQNSPVITAVERSGGNVIISASVTSKPSTSYSFEFFSAAAAGPGGRGVSEVFLGGQSAVSNGSGVANVSLTVPYDAARTFFSATCTDMTTVLGNTSEFSDAAQPAVTPDTTAPTVTIASPVRNSTAVPSAITGTASDDRGVQRVLVTLRRGKDGYYWNGTAFVSSSFYLSTNYTGATTSNWSVTNTLPTAGQLSEDTFLVAAYATDRAGNNSSTVTSFFTLYIAPTVDVTTPAHNSTVSTLPNISGTASDSSGVQSVQVSLMRSSDSKYWSGSGWGAAQVFLPTNYTAGVTSGNWSITGTLPSGGELSHQRYYLRPRATDIYGFATTGKTSFVYFPPPPVTSPIYASAISTFNPNAFVSTIRLTFTGELAASSTDTARYQFLVNGIAKPIDSATLPNSITVVLGVTPRSYVAGDALVVKYDLLDTQGRAVKGQISMTAP